ncbi:MAG: type II toxin-antitoxin system VapC family toxin [Gemmatimonadaceae bacterium]|nr:type II toxin-antitoxin system VapC family toxin [Gemmatimonadaceae bacterium]
MIVTDASAVVAMLLRHEQAERLFDRMFADGESLHAPHLLDVEVAQVVRRYWRAGEITAARGELALSDLAVLPIQRYPHEPLLGRIWHLRNNVTAYDAVYVALAEGLGAVLLTLDSALGRIPGFRVAVEVF